MELSRTGIILNTRNYEACVAFYRDLFGLRVLFTKDDGLTCFEFMGSYLMIETEGSAKPEGKSIVECPHKLRFNVPDVEEALRAVKAYGINAEIQRFDWGTVINIHDPDGNRIGICDETRFRRSVDG